MAARISKVDAVIHKTGSTRVQRPKVRVIVKVQVFVKNLKCSWQYLGTFQCTVFNPAQLSVF